MTNRLHAQLTLLRDYIIKYNTYFNDGYDFVTRDDSNGYISNGDKPVFPADDFGNYFYLRLPNAIQTEYKSAYQLADCMQGYGLRYDVVLVACIRNGDTELLIDNLLTTLGNYNRQNIVVTKVLYHIEDVTAQELSRIKREDRMAALQRMGDNINLCSIHFSFTIAYTTKPLSCITNPCSIC